MGQSGQKRAGIVEILNADGGFGFLVRSESGIPIATSMPFDTREEAVASWHALRAVCYSNPTPVDSMFQPHAERTAHTLPAIVPPATAADAAAKDPSLLQQSEPPADPTPA